jgi:hypothetical protein
VQAFPAHPGTARVTGLQAAHLSLTAQLRAWRDQFSDEEYGVLVELISPELTHARRAPARGETGSGDARVYRFAEPEAPADERAAAA